MTPSLLFARLAGARTDVLVRTPSDVPKYATMGGVIVSTAVVGAASAFFALTTAVGLSPWFAAPVALIWGVIVLNLDRMLVVSMRRGDGWKTLLVGAVARVVLAAVIGTVISTPMVLQIFKPEIESQLVVMQNEQRQKSQAEIDRTFADRAPLEAKVAQLSAIASGRTRPTVASDPEVASRQQQFDAANAEYEKAEQDALCELQGVGCAGGSGVPGVGELQRQKAGLAAQKKAARDAAKSDLDTAKAQAEQRIDGDLPAARAQASRDLGTAQAQLDAITAEQARFEGSAATAAANGGGLLARLEALSRLSAGNATMHLAHLAVFLLFFALELLPVIVKLLTLNGRPTTYDAVLAREDDDVLVDDDDERRGDREARRRVRDEIEQDRADRMIEAGKESTAHVMATHRAVSRRAVDVWAHVALARSDAELRSWYAAQGGGPFPLPPPAPPVLPQPNVPPPTGAHAAQSMELDEAAITRPLALPSTTVIAIPAQASPPAGSARPTVRP